MVLSVQSCLTLLPCLVWNWLEGGRLKKLLHKDSSLETLSRFLYEHPAWYSLKDAAFFYCCQLLCLGVSAVQIFLMDKFLGSVPLQSLVSFTWPPPSLFNVTTSCNFYYYGHTAQVENISGLCTLNYNFLYEKVFLALFLTFALLFITSFIQVLGHAMLAFSPKLRVIWMVANFSELSGSKEVTLRDLEKILGYPQFLLYQLIENNLIDPNDVVKIITKIVGYKKGLPADDTSSESMQESGQSSGVRHRNLEGLEETAV